MRPTSETVGGRLRRRALTLAILAAILTGPGWPAVADAQSLDQQVLEALRMLYETTPASRALAATAKGILVFPDIVRDNYVFEGSLQSGYGALLREGKIVGYYSTSSITYGFQAGVLSFGYALFLMTDAALGRLEQSDGWQVGRDPRVVIVSRGTTKAPEGAKPLMPTLIVIGAPLRRSGRRWRSPDARDALWTSLTGSSCSSGCASVRAHPHSGVTVHFYGTGAVRFLSSGARPATAFQLAPGAPAKCAA